MTAPQLAAQRFFYAILTGMALGGIYGFLRPLRPKHTALSDALFLAAALYGWLFLHFRLCRADIRIAYSFAMLLGGFAWEQSAGRLLRPVFAAFWKAIRKIGSIICLPFKKISKMTKILFASGRKWVTIKWSNRRHHLSKFGGKNHGKLQKNDRQSPVCAPSQRQGNDHCDHHRHRIVYGSPDRAAPVHE